MLSCVMIDVERGAACVCGLAECAGRRLVVGLAVRLVVLALGCGFGCAAFGCSGASSSRFVWSSCLL